MSPRAPHRRGRRSPWVPVEVRRRRETHPPEVEIADLPLEVNTWVPFLDEYTHISGAPTRTGNLHESVAAMIVSDACNVGLTPIADEDNPALTRNRLNWVAQNYIRTDTHSRASTRPFDYHARQPLADIWGGGATYRRDIQRILNRGESRNGLARDVFHGGGGKLAQRYQAGQENQLGALGLLVNIIVLWQTVYTQAALDHLAATGDHHDPVDVARLSPLAHPIINLQGRYATTGPTPDGTLRPLRTDT